MEITLSMNFGGRGNCEELRCGILFPAVWPARCWFVGPSGSIQWEIRRDSDGALMSRFGTNVVALDGFGRYGWLTLGSSFAYVDSVKPGSGPWVLHVDGKPVRRVYPRKLRDGSLLIIVHGLAAPFPADSPEVRIVGANDENMRVAG